LVGFEREGFEKFPWCSCLASLHSVELFITICSSERPRACYSWRVTLAFGAAVTSSWKIVKRPRLLPSWDLWSGCGTCHLQSGGKANLKKGP
jgi:hypothetical protein